MPPTTTAQHSLWLDGIPATPRAAAPPEDPVDVAVIGGGITGITTALLLKRAGARVAVIEAATVASGVTGATTAKVTALQSTILSQVRKRHGDEATAVVHLRRGGGRHGLGAGRARGRPRGRPPHRARRGRRTALPRGGRGAAR